MIKQRLLALCVYFVAPAKPVMGSEPIATTMSSLQIHWTVSYTGGPAISNYTVHWKENSSQSIWSFISLQATLENGGQQNQQGGTWSLMGLKPGTEYLLKITATNNIGSNASDIVEYATHSCGELTYNCFNTDVWCMLYYSS
jgi:hypothetical protein